MKLFKYITLFIFLFTLNSPTVSAGGTVTNSVKRGFGLSAGRDLEKKTVEIIKQKIDKKTTSGKPIQVVRMKLVNVDSTQIDTNKSQTNEKTKKGQGKKVKNS